MGLKWSKKDNGKEAGKIRPEHRRALKTPKRKGEGNKGIPEGF